MLNIGFWEICVVLVASLLFIGPERLPNVIRFFGRSYAKIRHASRDLRMAFQQEVDRVDSERRAQEIAERREALRLRREEEEASAEAPNQPVAAPDPRLPTSAEEIEADDQGGEE